jgi:lysophospholipase L1-like esterase
MATIPPHQIVIDEQGDSTTYGFQTSDNFQKYWQTCSNPPSLLPESLRRRFGETITVINNGHPGAMVGDLIEGASGVPRPYARQSQATKAQIVILNYALNDARSNGTEPVDRFRKYLIDFVRLSRAAGRIVVFEEPNPINYPINVTIVPLYVEAINSVANAMNVPVIKQYEYISAIPTWRSMLIDGVHPTDELYRIKAEREFEVVAPIVDHLMRKAA